MESNPRANELRKTQTDVEKKLWQSLRSRQIHNYKFRRQMPVGPYIVDFACMSAHLIIELDGSQHAENTDYDRRRTAALEAQGYQVIRFWNNDVLENFDGVLEAIWLALEERKKKRR